jgi:oligoribonuclease
VLAGHGRLEPQSAWPLGPGGRASSPADVDAAAAERETLAFLEAWVEPGTLADVRQQHLPGSALPGALHADARAFLSLSQSRCEHAQGTGAALGAEVAEGFRKASTHLALDDVRESIRELQYLPRAAAAPV